MSMCSNTMNSFFTLTGSSHGRCSSAFTQYLTLPCFPSKEVARALRKKKKRREGRTIKKCGWSVVMLCVQVQHPFLQNKNQYNKSWYSEKKQLKVSVSYCCPSFLNILSKPRGQIPPKGHKVKLRVLVYKSISNLFLIFKKTNKIR